MSQAHLCLPHIYTATPLLQHSCCLWSRPHTMLVVWQDIGLFCSLHGTVAASSTVAAHLGMQQGSSDHTVQVFPLALRSCIVLEHMQGRGRVLLRTTTTHVLYIKKKMDTSLCAMACSFMYVQEMKTLALCFKLQPLGLGILSNSMSCQYPRDTFDINFAVISRGEGVALKGCLL